MHLLLTNDDGIDAAGIAALERACVNHGARISVVAPANEASQIGHRVTTSEPLEVEERGPGKWPCTAPRRIAPASPSTRCWQITRPDYVLSGINQGGNLGHDIYISGTVAAAREAAYHGVPAAALSHYLKAELPLDWDAVAERVATLLEDLLGRSLDDGEYWNLNLPHLPPEDAAPELREAHPERHPLESSYRESEHGYHYTGRYHLRPRSDGSDVAVCFGGDISLTRLRL